MNKNLNDLPSVLSVKDMAHVLGIGLNLAYQLVRDGDIKSIRIRKQFRISRDALISYIQGENT